MTTDEKKIKQITEGFSRARETLGAIANDLVGLHQLAPEDSSLRDQINYVIRSIGQGCTSLEQIAVAEHYSLKSRRRATA